MTPAAADTTTYYKAPGDDGMTLAEAFKTVLNMASRTASGDAHEIEAIKLVEALAVGSFGLKP